MPQNSSSLCIVKLAPTDLGRFLEVIRLFEVVFEREGFTPPPENHLAKVLKRDDFLVFAAVLAGEVVGGITVYVLQQYYSTGPLAYIYDLAVATDHQRKGIGKALMAAVKSYGAEHGFEDVFVQAERVDEHAVQFYRSTQPSEEEDVVYFNYRL